MRETEYSGVVGCLRVSSRVRPSDSASQAEGVARPQERSHAGMSHTPGHEQNEQTLAEVVLWWLVDEGVRF